MSLPVELAQVVARVLAADAERPGEQWLVKHRCAANLRWTSLR